MRLMSNMLVINELVKIAAMVVKFMPVHAN